MPIYEYACPSCATSFETLIIRKSDEAEVACPTCKSAQVTRQMSRPAATRLGGSLAASGGPAPSCGPVG